MELLKSALAFFNIFWWKENVEGTSLNLENVNIENIILYEKGELHIQLANLPNKINVKKELIITNMNNEETVQKINIDSESEAVVNLKDSLLHSGKYAFYLVVEQEKIRLSLDQALHNQIKGWSHAKEISDFLVVPYTTIKNNFSVKVIDMCEHNSSNTLPHVVESLDKVNGKVTIKGKVFAEKHLKDNLEFIVKRRGSKLSYQLPLVIKHNKWEGHIDFSNWEPSKGIWDYYLKTENKKYRIQIENDQLINNTKGSIFPSRRESRWNKFYITRNGKLSSKIQSATIKMKSVEAKVFNDWKVKCWGVLKSSIIGAKTGDVEVLILRRNIYEEFVVPLKLEPKSGNEDVYKFEFELNYKDLIPSEHKEIYRGDVFLRIPLENDKQKIRFQLENDELAYQSRITIEDDKIFQIYFYSTINQQLSIAFKDLSIERNVTNIQLSHESLKIEGYAYLDTVEWVEKEGVLRYLVIRERESEREYVTPLEGIQNNLESHGYRYTYSGFSCELNVNEFLDLSNEEKKIFDLYVRFRYKGNIKERRVGQKEFNYFKDDIIDRTVLTKTSFNEILYLTYTPSGNIKIEINRIPLEAIPYLTKSYWEENRSGHEDIWLIGERPDTAQDTGYHFFKYCRENFPDMKVYYAIDSQSGDLENIEYLGNVLHIGTLEHYKISATATAFIGSHDLEYFLPAKAVEFESFKNGKRVFLQHGVLGRKNVEYHKDYYKYPFDLFCVSSLSEKNLVIKKLGYDKEDVKVTGLTRFDNLLKQKNNNYSILFIPTWRDWLLNEEQFLESDYFGRYKSFLKNPNLHKLLDEYNVELNCYPHYRMQPFIDHFDITRENIKVIKLGEKSVQDLLLESNFMITDYSSVSFDYHYMEKPVVFYHFDRESFFRNGILRPVEETFLGDICFTEDSLIQKVQSYIENGFKEREIFTRKKDLIFNNIDSNNCERVYNEIKQF
ncbi:CDP-glycerol glycerophosphotransferase family protein [Halobacillus sp. Marseille-Q1614]|uniref:CDP-glycerol glycerophosphotransferase family protein n=1 Tax=Halobacillus sp. Marseille-Q1614 TaxID=2709134 RepID=UPI00156E80F8|nr:CDP-glycerol glycerophosphotransferase family protein [Halobacillus sp. Marseille-Q1614]